MTAIHQFYLDRAAEAKSCAESADLANVRERHLLAELTWSGLAARAGRVGAAQEVRAVKEPTPQDSFVSGERR